MGSGAVAGNGPHLPRERARPYSWKMMQAFGTEAFIATLAILGVVIVISALLSGVIERSGFPQVAVFLALGALLGPWGLGWMDFPLDSPWLRVIASLALVLVLFSDALTVDVKEAKRHGRLALLVLGPGTMLSAALVALAGRALLDLSWPAAVLLGAALASTDPVLLRGLLRRPDLPPPVRHALGLESGMNDGVLLPVVLVGIVFLAEGPAGGAAGWGRRIFDVLVLGPAVGVAVGFVAVALLDWIRRRWSVRRDYESLYALGVAFTAFAGAEALGASGFLAAFASGLTIAALDVELCDCFLDYGQASAEMGLLFTFVAFGTSVVWTGLGAMSGVAWAFVVVALLVRPAVLLGALAGERLDRRSRAFIVWFGPRGLSSLLLVLLPVFAGIPGSEQLFAIVSVVVLVSVVIHG
ncbi:MAG: cation:proton antiporter, partial [Gemmatimonadota bacterium]